MKYTNKKYYCILAFAFFFLVVPLFAFAADGVKPKQVVFVRYNLKDEPNSAIVHEFKKVMADRGYNEGKNIEYIDFVTSSPEQKGANEVLNFVDRQEHNADIFITTSWTSLYVRSKLAKTNIPQLFAPALESTARNMLTSLDAEPGTNLSGVYLSYPPEKILNLAKQLLPGIRKYAFVYDSGIPADIVFKAAYGRLNDNDRHGITIYYLDLASGTDTVIQTMNKIGVDAFGGAVGVMHNLAELSTSRVPIVTALLIDRARKSMINLVKKSNIIGGLYNSFDFCGRQVAEMTADIFDGKITVDRIIPRPVPQLSVINLTAAARLNLSVPAFAQEAAGLVIR